MPKILKRRPDPIHYIIFGNGDIAQLLDASINNESKMIRFKFRPTQHMTYDNNILESDYVPEGWVEREYPEIHCRMIKKNVNNIVWEVDTNFNGVIVKRHDQTIEKLKTDCATLASINKSLEVSIARIRYEFTKYASNPLEMDRVIFERLEKEKKLLSQDVIPVSEQIQEQKGATQL